MTTSDWEDWLPRAIDAADPSGVAVWYLGCNGIVLKGRAGTTVWIDPYVGTGDPPRTVRMIPVPFDPVDVTAADAVFATHEHTDHVHGPSQAPILAATGASYYAPDASIAVVREEGWTDDYGVVGDQFETVSEGDAVEVGEFTVHVAGAHDPNAAHAVSYVFEHDAGTFFHGGDTLSGDHLRRVGRAHDLDLGVLAFGTAGTLPDSETGEPTRTKWYNDGDEVVTAAGQLQLDRLVPTHWDMWKGLTADPTTLHRHVASFDFPRRLEVLEIGDRVDI
jgi:L-ascorbate 6-phosphate lactonase